MLSIIINLGNINPNHNEKPLCTHYDGYYKRRTNRKQQVLMKMCRNWNFCILLVECKMVHLLGKTCWQFLRKLNLDSYYDLAIPLLGICPKELRAGTLTRYLYINVHSSIIHNNKKVETTQMSINRLINRQNVVHTRWNIIQPAKGMKFRYMSQ